MRMQLIHATETCKYARKFNFFLRIQAITATTRATFCVPSIFFNVWRSKHGKRANGHGITGKTGQKSAMCACSFRSAVRKGYMGEYGAGLVGVGVGNGIQQGTQPRQVLRHVRNKALLHGVNTCDMNVRFVLNSCQNRAKFVLNALSSKSCE